MEIRFPNISPEAKATEQLVQMRSYLYQLVQDLNLSLRQLEAPETEQATVQSAAQAAREQTAAGLKSLIVKTAETVSRQMEQMKTELRGEYVAVSDFGTYLERTSQEIEEDPTKITRYFKFAEDIQADVDKVDADFSAYKGTSARASWAMTG